MRPIAAAFAALLFGGCVLDHVRMEIPPPGGCDQCHRTLIAGNWELAVTPAVLGREGGAPASGDVMLRHLQSVPYHRQVPEKKLAVYAASMPTDEPSPEETGIQCFHCHRSPGPPHERARGHHPWGRRQSAP